MKVIKNDFYDDIVVNRISVHFKTSVPYKIGHYVGDVTLWNKRGGCINEYNNESSYGFIYLLKWLCDAFIHAEKGDV